LQWNSRIGTAAIEALMTQLALNETHQLNELQLSLAGGNAVITLA
jgi:hypothetical protein